jgi:hypothetical protein
VLKPKNLPLFPNLFNFNTKIKFIFQQYIIAFRGASHVVLHVPQPLHSEIFGRTLWCASSVACVRALPPTLRRFSSSTWCAPASSLSLSPNFSVLSFPRVARHYSTSLPSGLNLQLLLIIIGFSYCVKFRECLCDKRWKIILWFCRQKIISVLHYIHWTEWKNDNGN